MRMKMQGRLVRRLRVALIGAAVEKGTCECES
jgi:hypothetical protein